MLSLLASLALAAPSFTDLGLVLRAPSDGPFAGGVGAPTVAWDGTQYVMYFESPFLSSELPSDCATAYRIGRATSPDGLTWTMDSAAVVEPDREDPFAVYSCAVSQPAVVYKDGTWHLFVAMSDEKISSSSSTNTAGGIGYLTSTDGQSFTVQQAPTALGDWEDDASGRWHEPDGGLDTLSVSMPTAVAFNDSIFVGYLSSTTSGTDTTIGMYTAQWTPSTSTWLLYDADAMPAWEATSWAAYGALTPSLWCDSATERFLMFTSGYTEETHTTRAVGFGSSEDFKDWTGEDRWGEGVFDSINHIDLMRAGDDWLVFYSMTDPDTDLKAIGVAVTNTAWGTPDERACEWELPIEIGRAHV